MKRKVIAVLAALTLGAGTGIAAAAVIPPGPTGIVPGLIAVGPVQSTDGFPTWYKDKNGLKLEQCGVWTVDAMCPPVAPLVAPVLFPGNYPPESFYSLASAKIPTRTGNALGAIQLEQAFATTAGPSAGDQITFARVRYIIDATPNAAYTITSPVTPVGGKTLVAPASGLIKDTEDIGVSGPPFSAALAGRIGPFLTWDTFPNDAILPNNPITGLDAYIGNAVTAHAIKGSPYNTNFFRIQGPGINPAPGADGCPLLAGIQGSECLETALFTVQGKISNIGGVTAEQATYSRSTADAGFVDVFASSDPDVTQTINVSAATGFATTPMTGSTTTVGNYFAHVPFAGTLPATVTVTNTSDTPNSIKSINLVDRVTGTANYDPATRSLTINAASSDTAAPAPVLTASGFALAGVTVPTAGLTVPLVAAPPVSVTVTSSKLGTAKLPVTIGAVVVAPVPVVANAGPDQTVATGQLVTLNGSASTGVISTYSWLTPGITLTNPTTANPTFTAPAPGIYIFALTVTGPSGTSTSAVKITAAAAAPGAPTALTGLNATATSVDLSWTAPANSGAPITQYVVRSSIDGGVTWAYGYPPVGSPAGTSWTWTGLKPATSHLFQVIALNSVGWGAWSATSPAVSTTAGPAVTVPGAPTALTGGSATTTSIALSWTPPVDSGAPITQYVVRSSIDAGVTWAYGYPPVGIPVGTSWTWTGLTPATPYVFQVIALNSIGWGAWSATSPAVSTLP